MFGDCKLNSQTEDNSAHLRGRYDLALCLPDVFFIVTGTRLSAHRKVLEASVLSGLLKKLDDGNELKLNANLKAFKVMLYYIYNKSLPTSSLDETDFIIELLKLGYEYKWGKFMAAILATLSLAKLPDVLKEGQQLREAEIYEKMLRFVDEQATMLIEKEFLKMLNKEVLIDIIKRDTFPVYELSIFKGVMAWGAQRSREDLKLVLKHIRFTLFQIDELRRFVEPNDILEPNEITQIIEQIKTLPTLLYRHGRTHRSEQVYELLKPSCTNGFISSPRAAIRTSTGAQLFKLPTVGRFNYIKMRLNDAVYTAYCIEVSRDQREWTRIVDFGNFKCYWDQHLYFELRELRYIHVMPAKNVHNFQLRFFHIDYDFVHAPLLIDGIMAPAESLVLDSHHEQQQPMPQAQVMRFNNISTGRNFYFTSDEITERFWQPRCINCIYIMRRNIGQTVAMIESSLDHEHFQVLAMQRDCQQQCFFFEAPVACAVRVTLQEKPQSHEHATYISFFYHPGQPALMLQCEA